MLIQILKTKDPMYWYSHHIHELFKVERIEKDLQLYWVREPSGFLNFVRFEDCRQATIYDIAKFQKDCYKFNTVAGKDQLHSWLQLQNQVKLIVEEVNETMRDADAKDITGVVDGCVDVLVTALGLKQQLESLGIDVNLALKLVAENNLSKLTTDPVVAQETVKKYSKDGVSANVVVMEYDGKKYYVVKDSNGKVRKPVDFVSVNLYECFENAKELSN